MFDFPILLDGRPVEKITAFLFHKGGNDDPEKLIANENKSFIGSYILGMGFTFDDTNPDATPISEMHRLIEKNPKNAEVIFPYIGGEEVNSSPTHAHHRYVINFGEMSEEEARENYPDLMAIVEEKVKPQRVALPPKNNWNKTVASKWWLFGADRKELKESISECDRVLVISRISPRAAFTFLPSKRVYSEQIVVFALNTYLTFSILQSRIHELWARFFSGSALDLMRYTPSDCFQTFPFPSMPLAPSSSPFVGEESQTSINSESSISPSPHEGGKVGDGGNLEEIGKTYYEYRAELMVRNNEGLTDTYNRFHNPEETDEEILKLRELHQEMDRAVLSAYGWEDIDTTCSFALEYLDLEDESELPAEAQEKMATGDYFFPTAEEAINFDSLVRRGKRKLPWRYRWSEATHDEVLARLLELNQQRAQEERLLGKKAAQSKGKGKGKNPKKKKAQVKQEELPLFSRLENEQ